MSSNIQKYFWNQFLSKNLLRWFFFENNDEIKFSQDLGTDTGIASQEEEPIAPTGLEEPFISIIDSFQIPRYIYNLETEKYYKTPNQALLGGIDNKIEIFRERYNSVWQRTIRHHLFSAGHRKDRVKNL